MEMELDQLVALAEQGNAATADIGLYGMAVINDAELRRPVAEFDRRLIDADAVTDIDRRLPPPRGTGGILGLQPAPVVRPSFAFVIPMDAGVLLRCLMPGRRRRTADRT